MTPNAIEEQAEEILMSLSDDKHGAKPAIAHFALTLAPTVITIVTPVDANYFRIQNNRRGGAGYFAT